MTEYHFDVSRIIGIKIIGKRQSHWRWLPRRQKTWLFGLIKRNKWQEEGFYEHGCYYNGDETGSWDASAYTATELRGQGYIVEWDKVYHKPHATVYLEYKREVYSVFDSDVEAQEWAEGLKSKSGKTFDIIKH